MAASSPASAAPPSATARDADRTAPGSASGPLTERQAIVGDRVVRLEDRLFQLSQALQKMDPDKAARLLEALQTSRSLDVRRKIDAIIQKLKDEQFSDALDRQQAVTADLQHLLRLLLAEPSHLEDRERQIRQLAAMHEMLEDIIDEQEEEKAAAEAAKADGLQDGAEQAEDQRRTADKTKHLLENMKDQAACKPGSTSRDNPQPETPPEPLPTPGQQAVEEAMPHQDNAAEKLDKKELDGATDEQENALQKLQQAKDQLAEKLRELHRKQQQELLTALEARFRAMLGRQVEINTATARLADLGRVNWKRTDQLDLARRAGAQRGVADDAEGVLTILTEDGTTVVLTRVVEQLRDDARLAADRLGAADCGPPVLTLQAEIEQALRDLIDAIKKKQAENEANQGEKKENAKSGSCDKKPLLPGSAELKLLRACQLRVTEATQTLHLARTEPNAENDSLADRLERLTERQDAITEMARQLHKKMKKTQ